MQCLMDMARVGLEFIARWHGGSICEAKEATTRIAQIDNISSDAMLYHSAFYFFDY